MKILYVMARALGMKTEDMNVLFEQDGTQMMRINYYPPCPQPERVMGLCPHTDAIGLAILLQVNETEGLQIKKDGAWIPVPYLPDAFVVNIGDILEVRNKYICMFGVTKDICQRGKSYFLVFGYEKTYQCCFTCRL